MPIATHTFRVPFWRMYLPAAVYAQVLFAGGMWLTFYILAKARGAGLDHAMVVSYALGAAAVAGLLVPAFLVYVYLLKVTVSPDGLTCSNGFGKMVTAPWDSVTGVKRLIVPGFPYLLVSTSTTRLKLWLPLFLGRMDEFVTRVEGYAGSEHILYQHLWQYADDH
ncbi:MAG: hypothetical protein ABGY75_12310 [Gemmataceae bacterium]